MTNLSLTDFQIFPSQYEQNGAGEKCCWLGGKAPDNDPTLRLAPYQTAAIANCRNPDWGFRLVPTDKPLEYQLRYTKIGAPQDEWYGVGVEEDKVVVRWRKEGVRFVIRQLGSYYTLEFKGKYVECEDGNLGQSTTIQVYSATPPTNSELKTYEKIPPTSFRILWKFVSLAHISGPDWVEKLLATTRKSVTIDRLFLPGTHDSGTEKNTQWLQTQFHTIKEQAAMGVRYFDLRVSKAWDIYHESNTSGITLKDALDALVNHLTVHTKEFFVVQLTAEDDKDFASKLFEYLKSSCAYVFKHIYLSDAMPTVEEAQGKIIFLFRGRFPDQQMHPNASIYINHHPTSGPSLCLRLHHLAWADKAPGSYALFNTFVQPKVYVQDSYSESSNSTKFDKFIKPTLQLMFAGNKPDWILNFTSVSNAAYPIHAAEQINPWVANLLMYTAPFPTGVLLLDDARVGNIANIIALNFA